MPSFYAVTGRLAAAFVVLSIARADAESSIRVVVADAACSALNGEHHSRGADYVPGVDVRGQPVVEADLARDPMRIPIPITFDVTVDVAERLGLSLDSEALLKVAQISERGGHILINGKPASELGRNMALAACAGQLSVR